MGHNGAYFGGAGGGKRIGGMRLYRLQRGVKPGRGLRRAVAREEESGAEAWEKSISRKVKRTLGPSRPRNRDGYRKGGVWDDELARVTARGIGATGNVRRVSRTLGLSPQTIYRHRRADAAFAARWQDELAERYARLELSLLDRMTDGWDEDVWYCGRQVGTRRRYDHNGAVALLRLRRRTESEMFARELAAEERRLAAEAAAAGAGAAGGNGEDCGYDCPKPSHRERNLLLIQMMERHRNRNPEEWDGDIHIASKFDLTETYADVYGEGYRSG